MPSKFKSLLGSNRPSYFREKKSRPVKFRPQRVKFRRRYATSLASEIGTRLWRLLKTTLLLSVVGVGGFYGRRLWLESDLLKISEVQFVGPPPQGLPEFLGLKPGQNIFKFKARPLEDAALSKFKELESISLDRHPSRQVIVEFKYRTPLAVLDLEGEKWGVDGSGVIFPLNEMLPSGKNQPELIGFRAGPELETAMRALSTVSQELPDFYSLIKIIKTDRMQPLRLVFSNEVVVYWGELETENIIERAKRIQQVFREYSPTKQLASVRFVTDDRLVLDQNWTKNGKKEGPLGKT